MLGRSSYAGGENREMTEDRLVCSVFETHTKKLWVPYGNGWTIFFIPPRLRQLRQRLICWRRGHVWSQWQRDGEGWWQVECFEEPVPYSSRVCRNDCGTLQRMLPEWMEPGQRKRGTRVGFSR